MSQLRACVTVPNAEYDHKSPDLTLHVADDLVRRWITVRIKDESVTVESYELFRAVKACLEIKP